MTGHLSSDLKLETILTIASLIVAIVTAIVSLATLHSQVQANREALDVMSKEIYATKNSLHELRFMLEKISAKQEHMVSEMNYLRYSANK